MPNRFHGLAVDSPPDDPEPDPSSVFAAAAAAAAAPSSSSSQAADLQDALPHADSYIDQTAALRYWSSISADNNGVLGGYPQVSRADLQGSANFVAKLKRRNGRYSGWQRLRRAADCGAGIGRVTRGMLAKVAQVVDLVEPVRGLTDVVTDGRAFQLLREQGRIGDVYNVGLENWTPRATYSLIWNQWCVGQLTDAQLVAYLRRVQPAVEKGGWIVVKENLSTDEAGRDIFDATDSSVTRTDQRFRRLFEQAGLRVVATELQRGMPKSIYPVRSYALQPEVESKEVGEKEDEDEDEDE